MIEREMQELLWKHPEKFLNEPLKQFAWETSSDVGRADLVFEDQYGRLLIIEVKRGKLPREAIGQLLDYFGMMKHRHPDKPVEMMVVAWTIPPERRLTCESRDILCREISEKTFRDIAAQVGYVFSSEANQPLTGISVITPTGPIEEKSRTVHAGRSTKPRSRQQMRRSFCRGATRRAKHFSRHCSICRKASRRKRKLLGSTKVAFLSSSISTVWVLHR